MYSVLFVGIAQLDILDQLLKKWICHECKMPLFLKYATDNPDGVDERGFGRVAYEPFRHNEVVREIDEVFE